MRIAAGIDPGTRHCGIAVVDLGTRRLLRAWLCSVESQAAPKTQQDADNFWRMALETSIALGGYIEHLVKEHGQAQVEYTALIIERQAIRGMQGGTDAAGKPGLKMKTRDPQVIINLAHVTGALLCQLGTDAKERHLIWPQSWNGNKKKAVANTNVWRRLDAGERQRVHDVTFAGYDEDGLGIFRGKSNNVVDAIGIAKWYALQPRLSSARVAPPSEIEEAPE